MQQREVSSFTASKDKNWALYTIVAPDWKEARCRAYIYPVSLTEGVAATKEQCETSPRWSRDASFHGPSNSR